MASPKKKVEQVTEISGSKIELGYSEDRLAIAKMSSENFPTYVAQFVAHKYASEWYIAEVHISDVKKGFLGWIPLALDTAKHEVKPAVNLDEAHRRSNVILCWKPRHRYIAEQAEWKKKQDRFNNFVAQESHQTQAAEVSNQLKDVSKGGITATPLTGKEED